APLCCPDPARGEQHHRRQRQGRPPPQPGGLALQQPPADPLEGGLSGQVEAGGGAQRFAVAILGGPSTGRAGGPAVRIGPRLAHRSLLTSGAASSPSSSAKRARARCSQTRTVPTLVSTSSAISWVDIPSSSNRISTRRCLSG